MTSQASCAGVVLFRWNDKKQLECAIVLQDKTNYGFPKGGRKAKETCLQNALRELEEETGVTEQQLDLLPDVYIDEINDRGVLCVRYFVGILKADQGKLAFRFDPEEIDQVEWMSVDAACSHLKPRRQTVLRKAVHSVSRCPQKTPEHKEMNLGDLDDWPALNLSSPTGEIKVPPATATTEKKTDPQLVEGNVSLAQVQRARTDPELAYGMITSFEGVQRARTDPELAYGMITSFAGLQRRPAGDRKAAPPTGKDKVQQGPATCKVKVDLKKPDAAVVASSLPTHKFSGKPSDNISDKSETGGGSRLPDLKISKALSWVLRHKADDLKLSMSPDGYVAIDELVTRVPQLRGVSRDRLKSIVDTNDKQRFGWLRREDGSEWVRANQGHSQRVADKLQLDETKLLKKLEAPLPVCVHGTDRPAWKLIEKQGLSRMGRTHIHFASGEVGEHQVISGMRKGCPVRIYIDMAKAMAEGIEFYQSENGVILSRGHEGVILPKYFSKVVVR